MKIVGTILIVIVALQHLYFLVLEMFLWTKPLGLKTFRMSIEDAMVSKALAQNMGLYNGFLAAGLFWSLTLPDPMSKSVALFFLSCIIVAAVFGGFTASMAILFVQGIPALLALLCLTFLN